MRLGTIVFFISLVTVTGSFAQADSTIQELTVYKTFGGAHFEYQKDTALYVVSPKQVLLILKDDPLAYKEFQKARSRSTIAGILGFTGAVILAIPIGTAIGGGDPEWGIALGGAAIMASSFPFMTSYRNHAYNAVEIYNKKHRAFKPRLDYYFSGLGAQLILRF